MPDSPPTNPLNVSQGIPEGLATKLGKFGAPLVLILGALSDSAGIELDGTSEKAFYASLAMILVTMIGRYAQGYALYRDAPSPATAVITDDASGEPDDEFVDDELAGAPAAAPAEADLEAAYPGEREAEPGFDEPANPLGMDPERPA